MGAVGGGVRGRYDLDPGDPGDRVGGPAGVPERYPRPVARGEPVGGVLARGRPSVPGEGYVRPSRPGEEVDPHLELRGPGHLGDHRQGAADGPGEGDSGAVHQARGAVQEARGEPEPGPPSTGTLVRGLNRGEERGHRRGPARLRHHREAVVLAGGEARGVPLQGDLDLPDRGVPAPGQRPGGVVDLPEAVPLRAPDGGYEPEAGSVPHDLGVLYPHRGRGLLGDQVNGGGGHHHHHDHEQHEVVQRRAHASPSGPPRLNL